MSEQIYKIEFQGYWREVHREEVPGKPGIFCVYTCLNYPDKNRLVLRKLLYIGAADNAVARIATHEKRVAWARHLEAGEEFCYSFARVTSELRERCEAALVHHHRPPENAGQFECFDYDKTNVALKGKAGLLVSMFTVQPARGKVEA